MSVSTLHDHLNSKKREVFYDTEIRNRNDILKINITTIVMKFISITILSFLFVHLNTCFGQTQTTSAPIEVKRAWSTTFYQNGKRLKSKELTQVLKGNSEAYALMQRANSNNTIRSVLGGTGGFLVGYQLGSSLGGKDPNWAVVAVGAGLIGLTMPFAASYGSYAREAVGIYNRDLEQTSLRSVEYQFGLCSHGVGLTVRF